jgi:hypothetical protein
MTEHKPQQTSKFNTSAVLMMANSPYGATELA